MNKTVCKILKKYAALREPEGSKLLELKHSKKVRKSGLWSYTAKYEGQKDLYRKLKRAYAAGTLNINSIKEVLYG